MQLLIGSFGYSCCKVNPKSCRIDTRTTKAKEDCNYIKTGNFAEYKFSLESHTDLGPSLFLPQARLLSIYRYMYPLFGCKMDYFVRMTSLWDTRIPFSTCIATL